MTISSTTVKNSYNGNGSTRTFTYTFKIFNDSDLQVIVRSADGTETTKILNTHYTVSGAGNSNGGSITFIQNLPSIDHTPTASQKVTLIRNIPQTQSLDYISNDTFPAESHEEGLDRAIMVVQQLQEEVNRSLKLSKTNTMNSTEFYIDADARAGKILGFDDNGELVVSQELGTYKGNWSTATTYSARDIVKDTSNGNIYFCNTGHTSTGVAPLSSNADSAKWNLLVDVATVVSATASATAAATAAANSAAQAASLVDSVSDVQDKLDEIQTVADDLTEQISEIDTVSAHVQNIDLVGNSISNVNTVAANLSGINSFNERYRISATQPTTSLDIGDLWYDSVNSQLKVYTANGWEVSSAYLENLVNDYTYNISGSPTYVQGASNNANNAVFYYTVDSLVNVFVNGIRLIPTSDYQLSNNNRVTFSNPLINGDVVYIQVFTKLTVAQEQLLDAKVTAAQTAQTASETARNSSQTYSTNSSNSATASANSATASATSATNSANSATAAATSATNAASSATSALNSLNSFLDSYSYGATPSANPTQGDLWYDTANTRLKIYINGSWEQAGAYLEGLINVYTYNCSQGQTTFTGTDVNNNTLVFGANSNCIVYLNGIRLVPTSDYTYGVNSISLVIPANNGDVLFIEVISKLQLAEEQALQSYVASALQYRNTAETHKNNAASSATSSANSATASATSASNAATSASAASTSATNAASSATSALNSLNSFLDTYSYGATAPNNPTTGDLWFDSSNTRLKIYINGSWQQAGAYLEGLINIFTFNCTQGQTTFTGADINNNTLSFGGTTNCIVYLNGIRLVPELDYTYGVNSLTLAVAANNGDVLFVEVITKLQLAEEQTIQGYVSTTLGYKNTTEGFKNTTEGYKNAAQTSATNAANSATASATSATASQTSATASAASAASSLQSLNSFNAAYTYGTTPPNNPDNGAIWFDTATTRLKVYVSLNNTGWVNVGTYVEGLITNYTYIATQGQTVFTGNDIDNKSLSFNATGNVFVFVNGIRITPTSDYVLSASNTCTLTVAANSGDVIYIEVIQKISLTEEQLLQSYVASALADKNTATTQAGIATTQAGISTTKASEASASAAAALSSKNASATSESNALSYRNTAETHKNNAASSASAAAASAALATVGGGAFKVTANDTQADVFNQKILVGNGISKTINNSGQYETVTLALPFTETVITPTNGQTTFSLNYTVGFIQVFVNGVKLINGVDFTATNGTTIELTTGLLSNDVVDIIKYS